jgi:Cyanobacterial TRADD-N associated 2-Transmembrane domain
MTWLSLNRSIARLTIFFSGAWLLIVTLYFFAAIRMLPSFQRGYQQEITLGREFELDCKLPTVMVVGVTQVITCASWVDDPQGVNNGDTLVLQVRDISLRTTRPLRLTLHHDPTLHQSRTDYGSLIVTPTDESLRSVPISVYLVHLAAGVSSQAVTVELPVSMWSSVPFVAIALLLFSLPIIALSSSFRSGQERDSKTQEDAKRRIEVAAKKADEDPGRAKYAWELAEAKLEEYFDKNLSQVHQVFRVALGVMVMGFLLVIAAAILSLNAPQVTPASKVSAIAGIVAQFIGATFMVMYRSTVTQANEFMSILERINTVGMAIRVLDAIPDGAEELKNKTRAAIVELLVEGNRSGSSTLQKRRATRSA